jgi:hypothetical protein
MRQYAGLTPKGKFINVTAVPEPSTYALLALGVLVWAGFAKRRKNGSRP